MCVFFPDNTHLLNSSRTSLLMYLAGGWARWEMGRDGQHEAAHEEFHFVAFQSNLPGSLGQARASRHASGWPSVLNTSDNDNGWGRQGCLFSLCKELFSNYLCDCLLHCSSQLITLSAFLLDNCRCDCSALAEVWLAECSSIKLWSDLMTVTDLLLKIHSIFF